MVDEEEDPTYNVWCLGLGMTRTFILSLHILEDLVIEFITEMTHKTMPMEDKVENELKILSA